MSHPSASQYQRCFISAPFGLELGLLPELLAERNISWEWAKEAGGDNQDTRLSISRADFVLVVINGTSADYRGVFDAGVAVGLRKPVLLVQTKARVLPLDLRLFTTVKTNLVNRDALNFHLDLFLASPPPFPDSNQMEAPKQRSSSLPTRGHDTQNRFYSEFERRAYNAIIAAGGSAISEPQSDPKIKYRPDFLAWFGHLDAELLDPTVIEVRARVEPKNVRRLEEQLLTFMVPARVRIALVLTTPPLPERDQQLSPNILWLTIEKFEELTRTSQLGAYVRAMRAHMLHGSGDGRN